jgi:hypothetical protein
MPNGNIAFSFFSHLFPVNFSVDNVFKTGDAIQIYDDL